MKIKKSKLHNFELLDMIIPHDGIEIGKHYIVVKESSNGMIKKGEPIYLEYHEKYGYTLFRIGRVGKKEYKKLGANSNTVHHFDEKKLIKFLDGVEVMLDIRYARERIDLLQHEIMKLEKDYNLTPKLPYIAKKN